MRSALLEIPGVTRVQISLEKKEALVTYDARVTTPAALIAAVEAAPHPAPERSYAAAIKEAPRSAPSAP